MSLRDTALQKLTKQADLAEPVNQTDLDAMVAARREGGNSAEAEELLKAVDVGVSKQFFFFLEQDGKPLSVLKVFAQDAAGAMAQLDNIGKLVPMNDQSDLPRLHKWR